MCRSVLQVILTAHPFVRTSVERVLSSAVLTGYAINQTLASPYTSDEARTILNESKRKELQSLLSSPREPSIDWRGFLADPHSPLHADIPYNLPMSHFVHNCLSKWLDRLSDIVIYPATSTKSISRFSRDDYFRFYRQEDDGREITTLMLEQLYCTTGYKVEGPCEMRQRWYPTIINPRTYFAMGGTAYHISKHCGRIFEELTQAFPPTEKYRRVRPDWISIDEDEEFYIFDLESFTSKFHEHQWFIGALSEYVGDREVTLFDSHIGRHTISLRQLLQGYIATCREPEFNIMDEGATVLPNLVHCVAGFLGVYGNIMSCTFPHGVVNAMSGRRRDSSYAAGDDGGVATGLSERKVHASERTLGTLAEEKVFILSEQGAVALKRAVIRFGGSIVVRDNVIWPSFCYLLEDKDWERRFQPQPSSDRFDSFLKGAMSMFMKLSEIDITDDDRFAIFHVFREIYERHRIPLRGRFLERGRFAPSILPDDIGRDPYRVLLNRFPPQTFRVPMLYDDCDLDTEECWFVGEVYYSRPHEMLTWWKKMGYVETEIVEIEVLVDNDFERVLLHLKGRDGIPVYRVSVIEDIPSFLS